MELTCATYLEVFDMIESVAFYRDLLGFELVFASPEVVTAEGRFSHFVRLRRGQVDLMLNTAYDSNERPAGRTEPRWDACKHIALYMECDSVEDLFAEFSARGLKTRPPARTNYGYIGFSTSDPDGYSVTFHQALK